jgi:hypothetical protein
MKYIPRALLLFLLLASIPSLADSDLNFLNLNVNFGIGPNSGTGDNMGGTIFGPGISFIAGGGTPFSWFNNVTGFAPGSSGGGSTNIFFDFVSGTIGPYTLDDINEATFNAGGFTFPTNGKDFTITVPASIGVIVLTGCTVSSCQTLNVYTKPGQLTLSFQYYNGLYFGSAGSFTTTPEPGRLGLVALGLGICFVMVERYGRGESLCDRTLST